MSYRHVLWFFCQSFYATPNFRHLPWPTHRPWPHHSVSTCWSPWGQLLVTDLLWHMDPLSHCWTNQLLPTPNIIWIHKKMFTLIDSSLRLVQHCSVMWQKSLLVIVIIHMGALTNWTILSCNQDWGWMSRVTFQWLFYEHDMKFNILNIASFYNLSMH